jgi:LDH2 family malate/lactate/ureidoglycolate dehydrogenase
MIVSMLVPVARLQGFYVRFARRHGADEDEASTFAARLLRADLRGHTTQGVGLLPYIGELLADHAMAFGRPFEVVRETSATAAVDGHRGVGQVIGTRAMNLAIAKARGVGVGFVAVRGSSDYGMASAYALQALEAGQIGISMSTGPLLVAPWGGRDARFCTNPIAVAVPAGERDPIVVDMATSAYSMGAVVRAARDGRRLGPASVADAYGRYTDDPATVILDVMQRESRMAGALLPAGPKGFGWILVVELLAGLLSGERTWLDEHRAGPVDRPAHYGQTFIAIAIEHFQDPEAFAAAADRMIETVTSSPPAEGFERVRLHGSQAALEERRRREHGIPVRDEEWAMVERTAERLGIAAG